MDRSRRHLVVTDTPRLAGIPTLQVCSADAYIEGHDGTLDERLLVINLCRSYHYLSKGYYVSLLAQARNQRVLPSLEMIEEINNPFAYFRRLADAGIETIDFKLVRGQGRRLLPRVIVLDSDEEENQTKKETLLSRPENGGLRYTRTPHPYTEITAVLGRTHDERFRRPCASIYKLLAFPILRIRMYEDGAQWRVGQIYPGSLAQLGPEDLDLLTTHLQARAFVPVPNAGAQPRSRIACLWDAADALAPSDEDTVERFIRIASRRDVVVEVIDRDDLDSLAEYDALFIRTVTAADNYAFTFAKVAESLGMPVIDDSQSILRCSNKVYLYELFRKNGVPMPASRTVSRRNALADVRDMAFPLVLKLPDGTFSQAVRKVEDLEQFQSLSQEMFRLSPLLIVQQFMPTPYDWRVCTLEGKILFICKYYMVKDHWQIAKRSARGNTRFGRVEAVASEQAPEDVKRIAVEAADLIGQGFYGVDLKETENGAVVVEVNDNPNLETGYEDAVEKERVYETILDYFSRRIEEELGTQRQR